MILILLVDKMWNGPSVGNKIKDFIDTFDHLEKVMTNSVILETGAVTERVSKAVGKISKCIFPCH